MADPGKKSRKRFAANSKPLEQFTFFVDRSLGKKTIAEAFRTIGARIEIHDDHFAENERDEVWLKIVGKKGWIVLTKDDRIRYHVSEQKALIEANVCAFILRAKGLQGREMAEVFIKVLPKMIRFLKKYSAPFVATITRTGDIHSIDIEKFRGAGLNQNRLN